MPDIAFYHLTRSPLEAVLPRLLEKAYAGGYRIVVRSSDAAQLKKLDQLLWTYDTGSFLPHALDASGNSELQPILLTPSQNVPNGATVLVLIDGQVPDDVARFERVLYLFDAGDEAAMATARRNWVQLKDREDIGRSYWQQDEGGGWKRMQ